MKQFTKYPIFAAKQPKWWDSQFACKVIDAYRKGELSFDNLVEWETNYNGGVRPTNMGTKEILKYHISTGKDPRDDR